MIEKMDIYEDLYQPLVAAINMHQGGMIKPQTWFQVNVNNINDELYRESIAAFQLSQQVSEDVAPLIESVSIHVAEQPGQNYDLVGYPDNYGYYSSAYILLAADNQDGKDKDSCGCPAPDKQAFMTKVDNGKCSTYVDPDVQALIEKNKGKDMVNNGISLIPNGQWAAAGQAQFKKPSYKKPIMTQYNQGFKIMPRGIAYVTLDYLKVPRKCVFAYTLDVDDNIIYDQANSVQLEWPRSKAVEILSRLIVRYGLYVGNEMMIATGKSDINTDK